jgi:hypothetical protein
VAASKHGHYRRATPADFFKCFANAYVVACGNQSLSKRFYRVAITSCLVIHLGEVQIKLGVIALYFQSFAAQLLTSDITLLGQGTEHAYVGKIEWILRLRLESAANVS